MLTFTLYLLLTFYNQPRYEATEYSVPAAQTEAAESPAPCVFVRDPVTGQLVGNAACLANKARARARKS